MSDLPRGVAVEPAFLVEAEYVANAAERRAPHRAEHLLGIAKARRAGTIVAAGALADMTGSVIIVSGADERAARDVIEGDVYWRNGVWTSYRVRAMTIVVNAD